MTEKLRPRISRTLVNVEGANTDIYRPMERERFGNLSVLKFGGVPLGDADSMRQSVEALVRHHKNGEQVVVVVSAMGGITDMLDSVVSSVRNEDRVLAEDFLREIFLRHMEVLVTIPVPENERVNRARDLHKLCGELYQMIGGNHFISSSKKAKILAQGERMSEFLFTTHAKAYGLPVVAFDSSDFIITDSEFENARPDLKRTGAEARRNLSPVLKKRQIPIVTGFFGANEYGDITLLGRNCSDYTAGLIAGAMGAKNLYLYKNVNGIMTGNPKLDPGAETIEDLTYKTMYQVEGADTVVYWKTIEAFGGEDITTWVVNVFDPFGKRTRIVRSSQQEEEGL